MHQDKNLSLLVQGAGQGIPIQQSTYIPQSVSNIDKPVRVIKIPSKLQYIDLPIAKELTENLQYYLERDENVPTNKRKLYECLNKMLTTAICTLDKRLQEQQFHEIQKWFKENLEVVNFRTLTNMPKAVGANTKNLIYYKSQQQSPERKIPSSPDRIRRFIQSRDIERDDEESPKKSIKKNDSALTFESTKKSVEEFGDYGQTIDGNTSFMHKRTKSQINKPTFGSLGGDPEFDSVEYQRMITRQINEEAFNRMYRNRIIKGVQTNVLDWSFNKGKFYSIRDQKNEMYYYTSTFEKLGVQRTTQHTAPTGTLVEQTMNKRNSLMSKYSFMDEQSFLQQTKDSDEDTTSENDYKIDKNKNKGKKQEPQVKVDLPKPAPKIIDLTKEEIKEHQEIFESPASSPKKEKSPRKEKKDAKGGKDKKLNNSIIEKPLPPLPGYDIMTVKQRTNYTPDKLRSIQSKKINMLRMGRANILFRQEEQNEDQEYGEEVVTHHHVYPAIDKEKGHLNSAVIGRNDSITLSCFSRPITQTVNMSNFKPIKNVAERIQGVGVDERLVPKNKDKYIESQVFIDQLKLDLVKQNIICPSTILQKALVYENGRMEEGVAAGFQPQPVRVTYPAIQDILFHNPFAVEKKAKKGKKKKRK